MTGVHRDISRTMRSPSSSTGTRVNEVEPREPTSGPGSKREREQREQEGGEGARGKGEEGGGEGGGGRVTREERSVE